MDCWIIGLWMGVDFGRGFVAKRPCSFGCRKPIPLGNAHRPRRLKLTADLGQQCPITPVIVFQIRTHVGTAARNPNQFSLSLPSGEAKHPWKYGSPAPGITDLVSLAR